MRLFDAARDAEEWRGIIRQLPAQLQDTYFLPEYSALYLFDTDIRSLLFVYQKSDKIWAYSFNLQKITCIGGQTMDHEWFDIETPYGYGGPISNSEDEEFMSEANHAFSEWCISRNVVAEFVRFHPLLQNQRWVRSGANGPDMNIRFDRETASIDICGFNADKPPFNKQSRNIIKRAQRQGISAKAYPAREYIGQFEELYRKTMDRLGVDDYYYFDHQYFKNLATLSDATGMLLVSEQDGMWAAAALFFGGPLWLHYHLSASDPEQRLPGATNLLLHEAAKMGKNRGFSRLHLGGGRTNDPSDSLLKFKRAMATDMHSFYIGMRIHNPEIYGRLKEVWAREYPSLVPTYGKRLLCYRYKPLPYHSSIR